MNELDKHIAPEIHAYLNDVLRDENANLRRQVDDFKIDLQMANEENADLRRELATARADIERLKAERDTYGYSLASAV